MIELLIIAGFLGLLAFVLAVIGAGDRIARHVNSIPPSKEKEDDRPA